MDKCFCVKDKTIEETKGRISGIWFYKEDGKKVKNFCSNGAYFDTYKDAYSYLELRIYRENQNFSDEMESNLGILKFYGVKFSDEMAKESNFDSLFKTAKDVLGDKYMNWLNAPSVLLGGKTPINYLMSTGDYVSIENILMRIAHGVIQ